MSVDAVFTALADPTRREVMAALAREPSLTASRLAGELPVTARRSPSTWRRSIAPGSCAPAAPGARRATSSRPEPLGEAMAWMAGVGARWDARWPGWPSAGGAT